MISINDMLIIVSVLVLLHQQRHNELAKRTDFDREYDFVVVGAGTAGSIVAARLAEAGHRVLLLEAGGPVPVVSEAPGLDIKLISNSEFTWDYKSVPQKYAVQANKQHREPIVRAKVLGGGSVENALNYNRGKVHDYDDWNKEFGLKNWTYNKMLQFLLRSEDATSLEFVRRNPGIHAVGGPLKVSLSKLDRNLNAIFEAVNKSGYPIIDVNDMKGYGLSKMLTNTNNGKRWSCEDGFLQPNRNKKNFHILTFARVTKLNVEEKNRKIFVKSVEFIKNNEKHSVKARKEVILSAGVFGSPQLLMLSGIGPKKHLESLGIKSVADLPVGDNLQDHPGIGIPFKYIKSLPEPETLERFYRFFAQGKGPLNTLVPILLNIRTNVTKGLPKYQPDFEMTIYNRKFSSGEFADKKSWINYYGFCLEQLCLDVTAKVMYPKSRGTLRLKSKDPFEHPLIDPNYLSQTYDVDVMVAGLKKLFQIFTSARFQKLITYLGKIPGCNFCSGGRYDCDDYLKCFASQTTGTFQHPVGTCRIGKEDDKTAVVDESFRVKTIDNLRVIDGSVFPKLPGGHINVNVALFGEMGANIVLRRQ